MAGKPFDDTTTESIGLNSPFFCSVRSKPNNFLTGDNTHTVRHGNHIAYVTDRSSPSTLSRRSNVLDSFGCPDKGTIGRGGNMIDLATRGNTPPDGVLWGDLEQLRPSTKGEITAYLANCTEVVELPFRADYTWSSLSAGQ
jgi:hypothetical protein